MKRLALTFCVLATLGSTAPAFAECAAGHASNTSTTTSTPTKGG